MKTTQIKDARRNIKKQFVSFISIVMVIALGVGIYLACSAGATAVRQRADSYYSERNYRDVEIRTTLGATEEDVTQLASLDCVRYAEGVFSVDMLTPGQNGLTAVHVVTKTEKFDRFDVMEGRAPDKAGECAIVTALSDLLGIKPGDKITLRGKTSEEELLKNKELTVVGLVRHPDHYRVGEAYTHDVIVTKDSVDTEKLGVPYTGIFVKLNTDESSFSDAYREYEKRAAREIAVFGETRSRMRDDVIMASLGEKLKEIKSKILAALSDPETKDGTIKGLLGVALNAIKEMKIKLPVIGETTFGNLLSLVGSLNDAADSGEVIGVPVIEELRRLIGSDTGKELKSVWIVVPREANLSFGEMRDSIRMFGSVGNTFALLFVILGALVCYATIGKIVDEQRRLIGASKALGFYRKEIFAKYLLFGGVGSLLGGVSGAALSYFLLERILIDATAKTFEIDSFYTVFEWIPAIVSVIGGALIGTAATYFACRKLLAKPATQLLSGEVPVSKRKEKDRPLGKKPRSIYTGLIIRNIRTDVKRVIITVISVAGCCMLLVTGFSVKFTFSDMISRQFEEIIRYDGLLEYLPGDGETVETEIEAALKDAGCSYTKVYYSGTLLRIGDVCETAQVFACDPDALPDFYQIYDTEKKIERRISDGGIVITSGLADSYSLSVGDHVSILDARGVYRDVTVSEIYGNYAGKSIFLSSEYAESVFANTYRNNAYLVKNGSLSSAQLTKKLVGVKGFASLTDSCELREKYKTVIESLDKVVLLMIVMAAIMAAVVLLNLIKMQINQKKRELTIMRVNGFTRRETVAYILRENIITTAAGVLLGVLMGCLTAFNAIVSLERAELQLSHAPNLPACAISALITVFFAAIVNYFALRKIKKLKLSDVNN